MTTVINLRKYPLDERLQQQNIVRVDRRSTFGNPFRIGPDGNRKQVIVKYTIYFLGRMRWDYNFRAAVKALKNKRLGCWCVPLDCHAQIIANCLDMGFPKFKEWFNGHYQTLFSAV